MKPRTEITITDSIVLYGGDCVDLLAQHADNSIDACVTDPPYGIGFMGKEWDTFTPEVLAKNERKLARRGPMHSTNPNLRGRKRSPGVSSSQIAYDLSPPANRRFQRWCTKWGRDVLRVLKPGGYILSFGSARTHHRLAAGLEDAGFDLRDEIDWIFGQGFPKSLDAERAIARELCTDAGRHFARQLPAEDKRRPGDHVCAETPESREWIGFGTALKPAHEPIVVGRKPFPGQTLARVLLDFGTGALHIDGARLGSDDRYVRNFPGLRGSGEERDRDGVGEFAMTGGTAAVGRWPPNVAFSHLEGCRPLGHVKVRNDAGSLTGEEPSSRTGAVYEGSRERGAWQAYGDADGCETVQAWMCAPGCPVAELDGQSGASETPDQVTRGASRRGITLNGLSTIQGATEVASYGDAGGASRFFPVFRYEPKPFRDERDQGCEGLEVKSNAEITESPEDSARLRSPRTGAGRTSGGRNFHPTVKPLGLMRFLVRLVTRPGHVLVDPFMGSGTTGMAARLEGVGFVGMERTAEYLDLSARRIRSAEPPPMFALGLDGDREVEPPAPSQGGLFEAEA